jgi:hypothetical protein
LTATVHRDFLALSLRHIVLAMPADGPKTG